MKIPVLETKDVIAQFEKHVVGARSQYLAMYSSWLGGITKSPAAMLVPIDDHLVHRGDGVFEAIKAIGSRIYGLDPHLERLESSAKAIGLNLPFPIEMIRAICLSTVAVAAADQNTDMMLRLYVSRGPGGFTTNPYESVGSQLYLVITPFKPVANDVYARGVHVGLSAIGVKEGVFATIKSCNYLPNVLMKKEAIDRKLDFTVSVDLEGSIAESSTENFAIVSEDQILVVPDLRKTLRGITAIRTMEFARELVVQGRLRGVKYGKICQADISVAREAMMLGTTLDVLPVTRFENHPVGQGEVGPVTKWLLDKIREDLMSGPWAVDWRQEMKQK